MSLGISNVSDSHYGNYSCVLNTSLGMSSERILLVKMKRETGSYLYFVILTYFFLSTDGKNVWRQQAPTCLQLP